MKGARLIKADRLEEGELMNKIIENRMIRKNKNFLNATLGATGSGKSYFDLAVCNSWYQYHFKKPFSVEQNCCFSINELMKRLAEKDKDKKLKRGELLIFEEAGVNMGSLDFQTKISKIFSYVLQSFRSLNIGILFNLPTESMLNKNARLLLHTTFIMKSIDFENKKSSAKVFFRQTNVSTGKCYNKYLRARIKNRVKMVKSFEYKVPPKDIVEQYESKKSKFVSRLTEEFSRQLDEIDKKELRKMGRKDLTQNQRMIFNMIVDGLNVKQIAERRGVSAVSIYEAIANMRKKGYDFKVSQNGKKPIFYTDNKPTDQS